MNHINCDKEKPLILVVDDELVGRIYIESALKSEGYNTITAENGEQAAAMAKDLLPSMIIMDVMMPVMDGYQACVAIRAQEGQLKVPIIMLTGLDDIDSVEQSFASGATDFIVKPVNLAIFQQRVRHGLKTRETDIELYKQQRRQSQAYKIAKMGYWDWDIKSKKIYWSDEVYSMLSIAPEEFGDSHDALQSCTTEDDFEKIKAARKSSLKLGVSFSIEHKIKRSDNQLQFVHQHAELIKNDEGQVIRMLGIVQDITERHLDREKIHHQLYFDSLTDLPNRTLFHERLDSALKRPKRITDGVVILLINLDRFKNINDCYGHEVGDAFLISIANKLNQQTRTDDTLTRLSADEFALIIEGAILREGIEIVATKLLKVLSSTHTIEGNELICTGSIGISISSATNCDKEALIQQAALAVNHVKEIGGNQLCFFDEKMSSGAYQALIVEKELRYALERDELMVFYQPKVCVKTGKINGMEALIRWHHPEKGLVSPLEFIPVAEETGLIIPIGQWIFEQACRQTKKWHQQGYEDLVISINASAKQFHQSEFFSDICNAIETTGIDPHCVDLEVTESCTMNNIESAVNLLNKFREMGVLVSLDDFGTGFSSLSLLNQLPLDTLKVDIAFIRDINEKGEHGELAEVIIAMAKTLRLKTVAEGVELQHHLDFIANKDCDEYQGYFFSRPLPANEFGELLAINSKATDLPTALKKIG